MKRELLFSCAEATTSSTQSLTATSRPCAAGSAGTRRPWRREATTPGPRCTTQHTTAAQRWSNSSWRTTPTSTPSLSEEPGEGRNGRNVGRASPRLRSDAAAFRSLPRPRRLRQTPPESRCQDRHRKRRRLGASTLLLTNS